LFFRPGVRGGSKDQDPPYGDGGVRDLVSIGRVLFFRPSVRGGSKDQDPPYGDPAFATSFP
jgi:hypothetical protein